MLRLGQADAAGLGRGGERREAVRLDRDGLGESRGENSALAVALGQWATEVVALRLGSGAVDGVEGLLRLPLDGRAGDLALVVELLDGAVVAETDGSSADEAATGG